MLCFVPVPRNKEAVKLETEPETGTEIERDRWGVLVVSGRTGTNTSRALDLVEDTKPSSLKQGQQLRSSSSVGAEKGNQWQK